MLKQGVLEEFNKNNIKVKNCNIQKSNWISGNK